MRATIQGKPRFEPRRGFTLIEVLIVVVLLGIAGALVIPSMQQVGVLRVQAAVRSLVADITYVQGDAVAFQQRRAVWFGQVPQFNQGTGTFDYVAGNGYTLAEVTGPALDLTANAMVDPDRPTQPYTRNFDDDRFHGARLENVDFNGGAILIFDELGGPVRDLDGPEPGTGGSLDVRGSGSIFSVNIEAYTGRITVDRTDDPNP